jgi:biopolymer transport protein ExbD
MRFETHNQISKGLVDPAPLVDVVFLLLLFFLLSSPFVMQSGFGVILPAADTPTASSFQTLVVTVTRENLLFFNTLPTDLTKLQKELATAAQRGRNVELVIKADKQVSHGMLVDIMNVAVKAGINTINIATRPPAPFQVPVK